MVNYLIKGLFEDYNRRNLHTLPKHPPSVDGGSCTAVGNLLLAKGLFEGATLIAFKLALYHLPVKATLDHNFRYCILIAIV